MHPAFFNCYQITLPDPVAPTTPIGLLLILFIENTDIDPTTFVTTEEYTQSSGVYLDLREKHTLPFTKSTDNMAGVGHHTDVSFRAKMIQRLGPPHGTCTEQVRMQAPFADSFVGRHKHSSSGCMLVCETKRIRQICGCTDVDVSAGLFEATTEFPYCLNASLPLRQLIGNHKCIRQARYDAKIHCVETCLPSCNELEFDEKISSAPWPMEIFHENIYEKYIAKGRLARKFKPILESSGKDDRNSTECHCENKNERKRQRSELIRSNFLKITTRLNSFILTVYEDKAAYTTASFVSQLGGLLNLWSGITVYLAVEIVELIIRVCTHQLESKNKGKVEADQGAKWAQDVKKKGSKEKASTLPFH